ncbi:Peptide chain release factor 1 [Camellia lanceoleosa]|uniref:Peptide chain release factor 1 n=1 Tax=Camellia lanceoleosa TaxID=1840588 RepID=A0ACC0HGS8_9ERIC|nr:Peptide chain release factor 1 [Camellia lanceoleosa]
MEFLLVARGAMSYSEIHESRGFQGQSLHHVEEHRPSAKISNRVLNKAKALKVLCARLYEMERSRIQTSRSKLRSGDGGGQCERIRTYNFPQGRVTDHRVGIAHYSKIS